MFVSKICKKNTKIYLSYINDQTNNNIIHGTIEKINDIFASKIEYCLFKNNFKDRHRSNVEKKT